MPNSLVDPEQPHRGSNMWNIFPVAPLNVAGYVSVQLKLTE